jgi:hypothetical protein
LHKKKDDTLAHQVRMALRQKLYEPNQFDPRFNFRQLAAGMEGLQEFSALGCRA